VRVSIIQQTLEEPVPGMLAVRLGDVEALHIGGIATELFGKQARVVVEIPLVEGQAHLVIRENAVRTPISMIWALGANNLSNDPALNGLGWMLFAWRESISDPSRRASPDGSVGIECRPVEIMQPAGSRDATRCRSLQILESKDQNSLSLFLSLGFFAFRLYTPS
jgi:hypothetical protein